MELFVQITTILANIAVVVGIIIALSQLKKMKDSNDIQLRGIQADHDRRRKQATIDFYSYIYQLRIPLKEEIDKVAGVNEPITQKMIDENPILRRHLSKYLSLMERLAVGIHANVYDIEVYRAMASKTTINIYNRCVKYIEETRRANNNPSTYIEFERLIQSLYSLKNGNVPTTAERAKVKEV